jgi:hypothetical protein
MRPVDAALAGIDTLVLLDEADLARPLRDLAAPLVECDIGDPSGVVPAERTRPRFVSLTATGDAGAPSPSMTRTRPSGRAPTRPRGKAGSSARRDRQDHAGGACLAGPKFSLLGAIRAPWSC